VNRDELETTFAARLSKAMRTIKNLLLTALGKDVVAANVTNDVWDTVSKEYTAAAIPALENTFVTATFTMMDAAAGIAVDGVNERAASWAAQYGYDLVRGITDNDRKYLQTAVESFYRDGLTLGDLTDKVARQYSPVRAEMIAVTETTRAAVEGDRYYVQELGKLGAKMRGIVETNVDERVCPVCGGKQGADVMTAGYPPYHPRCRCTVRYVNEVTT